MARPKLTKERTNLNIRIDADLRQALQEGADVLGISINTFAMFRLQQWAMHKE